MCSPAARAVGDLQAHLAIARLADAATGVTPASLIDGTNMSGAHGRPPCTRPAKSLADPGPCCSERVSRATTSVRCES
jgi:hypothetical protein